MNSIRWFLLFCSWTLLGIQIIAFTFALYTDFWWLLIPTYFFASTICVLASIEFFAISTTSQKRQRWLLLMVALLVLILDMGVTAFAPQLFVTMSKIAASVAGAYLGIRINNIWNQLP